MDLCMSVLAPHTVWLNWRLHSLSRTGPSHASSDMTKDFWLAGEFMFT